MHIVLHQPRSADPPHHRAPLALLALAAPLARLQDAGSLRLSVLDANLSSDPVSDLRRLLADGEPALVAMTVHPGRQLASAHRDSRALAESHPQVPIAWGGYFPSLRPAAVQREPSVRYGVIGQGERAIRHLALALRDGEEPAPFPGLWAKDETGRVLHQTPELDPYSIDEWGWLDYEHLHVPDYLVPTGLGQRTINTIGAYGCPYRCNFCAIIDVYHSRVDLRPPKRVVSGVRRLVEDHGVDGVEFHDPTFFLGERRTRAICEGLAPLGIRWSAQGRVDTVLRYSDATWRLIKESGCSLIYFGAESGDDELLAEMEKETSVAQVLEVARRTRQFGLRPEFYFCFGNPSDPDRSIRSNIELIYKIKEIHPDADICPTIYTPTPQPGMSADARKLGWNPPQTVEDWTKPPWVDLGFMQKPNLPWLGRERVDLIRNFQVVLNTAFPRHGDMRLGPMSRRVARALGQRRYQRRDFSRPWEIHLFDRVVGRLGTRWRGHLATRGV